MGTPVGNRLRGWLGNLFLVLCSLSACLLLCELVIFRYIFVPDDVLHNVTIDGVVRYVPGTRAVMRHADKSTSLITINSHGWNSTKPSYTLEKPAGKLRIAVVGDSYVHGGFIDVDKGFPEVLEKELALRGTKADVLRFGIDGAPLSQYLHVVRSEVVRYKPDVVVIPIIHNDFDESYRFMHTRTGSSFLKFGQDAQGNVIELAPADFKKGMADKLRNFRTFRYLYYKTNAYLKLKWLVSKVYWGGSAEWNDAFISSAVDIRNLQGQDRVIRLYTHYALSQLKALSQQHGFRLLFTMDAVREAVYSGRDPATYEVGRLNALMAEMTAAMRLPFVDLHAAFAQDYKKHGTRFDFPFDWHWNELGNDIVATVIADQMLAPVPLAAAAPVVGAVPAPGTIAAHSARKPAVATARGRPTGTAKRAQAATTIRVIVPQAPGNAPVSVSGENSRYYLRQLRGVGT
jgi:GDSL-like Lipase/Acylhydrolase family